jgi:hypothetical protein
VLGRWIRPFASKKGHAKKMAKRNEGQVIENKRLREIADSAPSMISMAYGASAKRLVSFGETNPFVFAIFEFVNAERNGLARRDGSYEPDMRGPKIHARKLVRGVGMARSRLYRRPA